MKRFLTFLVFLLLIPAGLKIEIPGLTRPAEDIPEEADPDASVTGDLLLTRDNVLRILDQMDPDGAFILRSTESRADFMEYIDPSETLAEGYLSLMTAVHEQCHVYNSTPGGTRHNNIQNRISHACEWIYIGHGLHIEVPFTDVFPSSEMNETIPESLRTYRFNTYLNGDPAQASSQFGVYGLLDEFTAYCWGTGTVLLLEGFQKKEPGTTVLIGDFTAYAEFRFYILRYMLYAREHYPGVYAGIMDNEAFRQAFTFIDRLFAGYAEARKNDAFIADWNVLMDEMQKPEYVNMALLLAE